MPEDIGFPKSHTLLYYFFKGCVLNSILMQAGDQCVSCTLDLGFVLSQHHVSSINWVVKRGLQSDDQATFVVVFT